MPGRGPGLALCILLRLLLLKLLHYERQREAPEGEADQRPLPPNELRAGLASGQGSAWRSLADDLLTEGPLEKKLKKMRSLVAAAAMLAASHACADGFCDEAAAA